MIVTMILVQGRKGRSRNVVDHLRDTDDFVATGIRQWIYDRWIYSYPPGDRHCRGTDSNYTGQKAAVAI